MWRGALDKNRSQGKNPILEAFLDFLDVYSNFFGQYLMTY